MKQQGLNSRRMRLGMMLGCMLSLVSATCGLQAAEGLDAVPDPALSGTTVLPENGPKEQPSLYNWSSHNIECHPYAGAGFGYDSNIYTTNTEIKRDAYFALSPGLLLRTAPGDNKDFTLRWNSNLNGRFYTKQSSANTLQMSSVLDAALSTKPWDFDLTVGGGRFEDPLNVTFDERAPRAVGEGRVTATSKFWDKTSIELGYHFTYIDYHGQNLNSLDRIQSDLPVQIMYAYTDKLALYLKGAWDLTDFRDNLLNGYYMVDTRAGAVGSVMNGEFTYDMNVGFAVLKFKNDNGLNPDTRSSFVTFHGNFMYAPNEATNLIAQVYGEPRVTLAANQPCRPVYGAQLMAMRKLMDDKLQLTISGLYERVDNLPTVSDETYLTGSLRGQYNFRNYAFGYVSGLLTSRQEDGTVLDYTESRIEGGLGITL